MSEHHDESSDQIHRARSVYEDRARLIAFLSALYPSVLTRDEEAVPGWWVVFVDTPSGQLTWDVAPEHMEHFGHVERVAPTDMRALWDGHTRQDRNDRIDDLIEVTVGKLGGREP